MRINYQHETDGVFRVTNKSQKQPIERQNLIKSTLVLVKKYFRHSKHNDVTELWRRWRTFITCLSRTLLQLDTLSTTNSFKLYPNPMATTPSYHIHKWAWLTKTIALQQSCYHPQKQQTICKGFEVTSTSQSSIVSCKLIGCYNVAQHFNISSFLSNFCDMPTQT